MVAGLFILYLLSGRLGCPSDSAVQLTRLRGVLRGGPIWFLHMTPGPQRPEMVLGQMGHVNSLESSLSGDEQRLLTPTCLNFLSGPRSAGQDPHGWGSPWVRGGGQGMIPVSQASPASSVPHGCVTEAKGLSHIGLSLQLYRMGPSAHPRPTQSALFQDQGLWAPSKWLEPGRHGQVPSSCGPLSLPGPLFTSL